MKCPSCGSENPDDRFYCGTCGGTLRTSEISPELNQPVKGVSRDIRSGPLAMTLFGLALIMLDPVVYVLSVLWGYDVPSFLWIPGFSFFFLGLSLHYSDGMPTSIRAASGLLVVAAVSSAIICAAVGMTPANAYSGPAGSGQLITMYKYQMEMTFLMAPLVILPIVAVFGTWTRQRWGLTFAVFVALESVTSILLVLAKHTEAYVSGFLVLVFLASIPLLFASSSRLFLSRKTSSQTVAQ